MSGNGNDRLTPFSSSTDAIPIADTKGNSGRYKAAIVTFLLLASGAIAGGVTATLSNRNENEDLSGTVSPSTPGSEPPTFPITESPFARQLTSAPTPATSTFNPTPRPSFKVTPVTKAPSTAIPTKKPTAPTKKSPTKKPTTQSTSRPTPAPVEGEKYYDPTIVFEVNADPRLKKAYEEAIKVIQQIITGGRDRVTRKTGGDFFVSAACSFPLNTDGSGFDPRIYKDSIVYVVTGDADGKDNVLASAKVCIKEQNVYLIRFDNADLEEMLSQPNQAVQIITHELIHSTLGFSDFSTYQTDSNGNPIAPLPLAQQAYTALGYNGPLALNKDRGHWNPNDNGQEVRKDIMQPALNPNGMYFSDVMLAAMQDLNWVVNKTAAQELNKIYYSPNGPRILEELGWKGDPAGNLYFTHNNGQDVLVKIDPNGRRILEDDKADKPGDPEPTRSLRRPH